MQTNLFDFALPKELIAQHPIERGQARLLYIGKQLQDLQFQDIDQFLNAGDILVLNDTKVIAASFEAKCKISRHFVHFNLNKSNDGTVWSAFAKPAKKVTIGNVFYLSPDLHFQILDKPGYGEILIEFNLSGGALFAALEKYGKIPLPPYIKRSEQIKQDFTDYQTTFAKHQGAVAAPTAGLHFTQDHLKRLISKGVKIAFVTLHVGGGTFLPIKASDITQHNMHSEFFTISAQTAHEINNSRQQGGKVIAVGSTSTRVLESIAGEDGTLKAASGETNIFIKPGYKFKVIDKMLTNFHLPKSTLFVLVAAFIGLEAAHKAYTHAIKQKYRFFSYGDACFLDRND